MTIPVSISSRYDNLTDNQKLACRALLALGALGVIVIIVYYTPIWDLLVACSILVFIPCVFLVAVGWLGKETLHGLMALLNMSRAEAGDTVQAAQEVKAKTK